MTATLDRTTVAAPPARNPWLPMTVVMAATIMVALDTTIVNVALHQIGVDLSAGDGIEWVVTSYLLAVCAAQPATGWLADRFGTKRVFLTSVTAFTVASVLCALATSLGQLVFFRVLQGLGGGAMMPVGMAIALNLFPRERHGRAVSVWGMAVMVAPAVGPTLGGWLVTSVSWHWLFMVNLPIGLAVLFVGLRWMRNSAQHEPRPFDLTGLLLGSGGLTIAVLGIAQGNDWGWGSTPTLICLIGGATSLTMFVIHGLRVEHPLIEIRMFSNQPFRLSTIIQLLVIGSAYARLVFIPLQLEGLRGYSALRVGTIFIIPAICTAIGMNLGGRLVDRVGPRRPIFIGCLVMCVSVALCARLTLDTPIQWIVLLMSGQGFGMGLTSAPNTVAGIHDLPERLFPQASAVRALTGQVAGAVAVAVLGTLVAIVMGTDPSDILAQRAYNVAFAVAAVGLFVAVLLSWRMPNHAISHSGESILMIE